MRVTATLPEEVFQKLDGISASTGHMRSILCRCAIDLIILAHDGESKGKRIALVDGDGRVEELRHWLLPSAGETAPQPTEKQRRCLELRESGLSIRGIATVMGIKSTAAVRDHIAAARRKLNLPREGNTRNALNDYAAGVVAMHNKGLSIKEIAAKFGKTDNAVRHVIRRYMDIEKPAIVSAETSRQEPKTGKATRVDKSRRYTDADVSRDKSHYVSIRVAG